MQLYPVHPDIACKLLMKKEITELEQRLKEWISGTFENSTLPVEKPDLKSQAAANEELVQKVKQELENRQDKTEANLKALEISIEQAAEVNARETSRLE